ncbi:glycosyl hydrolase family 18 protein [Francisellaceae bacterium CB299]|jgi:chitinase
MTNKMKLISTVTLALMSGSTFANCMIDEAKDGWTGSIKFHCDSDTNLLENPINFEITNSIEAGNIWGLPGKSTVTKNGDKTSIVVEKWWPQGEGYVLPANQSTTLSFSPTNAANGTPSFEIKNFSVGGDVQEQGTIAITLPNKPNFIKNGSLANVIIYKGETKVAQVNDAQWGSTVSVNAPTGDLTVSVPTIDGSAGSATPASFSLAKDQTKQVQINYETPAPAEVGSIKLSASTDDTPQQSPTYTVKDSSGTVITQGLVNFNDFVNIDNLPATENGTKYTVSVDNYSQNGYIYKANPITVYVTKFNSSNVNLQFEKQAIPTENIAINVSGIPDGKKASLTLTNNKGDKQEIAINGNKTYRIGVPKDGAKWTITATSIAGFAISLSPNSFTADQDSQNITVKYNAITPSTGWPERAVVGYVRGYDAQWESQPDTTNDMISDAADHGYNVFVYSFAGQKQNGEVFYTFFKDDMKARIPAQMKIIHEHNGLALLSIGGAVNYFDPDMSGNNATITGQAMGRFLAENNYDGLDIDVEHPNASSSIEQNFLNYISAMRAEYKSLTGKDAFLTAAPQVSGWYGTGQWASGSASFAEPMYTQTFMDNAHLDAVFIQTYNQYGGANFGGKKGYDVGFLTMTFDLLSEQTQDSMPGVPTNAFYVPETTKIILGVPDYKAPYVTEAKYRTGGCLADASCSGVGLYNPTDITTDINSGDLEQHSQYGGLMTWILNSDSYQNWTWVDGVKEVAYK